MSTSTYPVHVDARLDPTLSRGLWLVKWLLAIPHYVVLAFLWLAFAVLSVAAFFAILVTGRYPRAIFDFNVGVLRWSWRVAYYSYGALGTDRYPPFTLQEALDYPAHLEVDYPQRLSRGLVLVKWWLLALPHYLVLGLLLGSGSYVAYQTSNDGWRWTSGGGLLGLLVLVAAVVLLFTGRYPRFLFDLVLGLNRWVLRVAAYATLMTDAYPPFPLDMGGDDPDGGRLALRSPAPTAPADAAVAADRSSGGDIGAPMPTSAVTQGPGAASPAPSTVRAWTAGRVAALVTGCVVLLVALVIAAAGAVLSYADRFLRDGTGFLMSGSQTFTTSSYALASSRLLLESDVAPTLPGRLLGDVKLTVTPSQAKPVFVGIAPSRDVAAYLGGVGHATVVRVTESDGPVYRDTAGSAPRVLPGDTGFWAASSAGEGTRSLLWSPRTGDWTVVVMNSDGTAGVTASVEAGAMVPVLETGVPTVLALSGVGALVAVALILASVTSARRARGPQPASSGR